MDISPSVVREYDRAAPGPGETETATFGLGCFWGPDAQFGALSGVVRTRVGYAGGTEVDPSYHALGDHTEVFQVEYEPEELSYRDLLEEVFRSHRPDSQAGKVQYQNIVFATTAAQLDTLATVLDERGLDRETMGTRIEESCRFFPAEDYHQKYSLRGTPGLADVFEKLGYDDARLRDSPAAAKLNGHAASHDIDGDLGVALDRRAGPQ